MKKHIMFLLLAGFAACGEPKVEKKQSATPVEEVKASYELAAVEAKEIISPVNLPGELRAYEMVQLYPKVNGFVREILVDRGTEVKKGQVLLRLEAPEVEQQYLAAKSKYLQAYTGYVSDKDRYDRLKISAKTAGAVAPIEVESAKNKMLADSALMESERAGYRALDVIRGYLTVTAPFNGKVTERNVHPGALVGPSIKQEDKAMLVVEQESRLRLVVNIPEVYSSQVHKGTPVTFKVNALPGKTFKGTVNRLAGTLNMKFRSETVEIDYDNQQGLLKPGMYAEVFFQPKRTAPAIVVPRSAIVTSMERKYVVTVAEGKAKLVDVQEGNSHEDFTEVFGDLTVGEQVVTNPTDDIKEGAAVQ